MSVFQFKVVCLKHSGPYSETNLSAPSFITAVPKPKEDGLSNAKGGSPPSKTKTVSNATLGSVLLDNFLFGLASKQVCL